MHNQLQLLSYNVKYRLLCFLFDASIPVSLNLCLLQKPNKRKKINSVKRKKPLQRNSPVKKRKPIQRLPFSENPVDMASRESRNHSSTPTTPIDICELSAQYRSSMSSSTVGFCNCFVHSQLQLLSCHVKIRTM